MLKWIEEKFVTIVEVTMTIMALILIYNGVFNFSMFIKAIVILLLMMIYKWVCHKIKVLSGPMPKTRFKFISEPIDLEKWIEEEFMFRPIFKKYPMLLNIIWILITYNPLLWMHILSVYIYAKIHDAIVLINGNKDIFFKKYFEIDATKWDWSVSNNEYYILIKFIFIYPFLRILFIPRKMRERILEKKSYRGLLRVRFIIYIYGLLLLSIGYYDYINILSMNSKLIIVYVYFALVWPLIMWLDYWINPNKKIDHSPYMHPYLPYSCSRHDSISFNLYANYSAIFNSYDNYCITSTFNRFAVAENKWCKVKIKRKDKIFIAGPIYEVSISYKERWMYEKAYGISYMTFKKLFISDSAHYAMDNLLFLYKKGEKEFGEEYMKKVYGEYFEKVTFVYSVKLFLMMDFRRLLGYKKEEWMLWPKDSLEYLNVNDNKFDTEGEIEMIKKILNEKINYENVPNKFVKNTDIYNKLLSYSEIFQNTMLLGCELYWTYPRQDMGEVEVLIRKLAKKKFPKKPEHEKEWDPFISPMLAYQWSVMLGEIETREKGAEYAFEFLNAICKIVNETYMKEYDRLKKDEFKLICEKYMKELLKRYKLN